MLEHLHKHLPSDLLWFPLNCQLRLAYAAKAIDNKHFSSARCKHLAEKELFKPSHLGVGGTN